ncbi:UDP-glucosyltransferase 2-like [Bacillus rossius redtenbacheri]|uniref:UDP-glucosyltransferase 2-like n=1 Tax=Bacillus rossius redtenbacheri TaxID=93214 RepID=UPI002FDE71F7
MRVHVFLACSAALLGGAAREASAAKILALLTLTTHSHHIWNRELSRALASRGHEVTVLSPDVDQHPVANLTYIPLEGCYEYITSEMTYVDLPDDTLADKMRVLNRWATLLCDYQLATEGAKLLLGYPDGRVFDLIITEAVYNHCFWPLISKFGHPPVVAVSPSGIPPRAHHMTDAPKNPAYVPDVLSHLPDRMDFLQRVDSLVTDAIANWMWNFEYFPQMQAIAERHFPHPVPSLKQYEGNFSLILSNTVLGYDYPRPLAPNLILVGGMHLKPPGPLDKKLQEFLDEAEHGAILFSLGSNLRSDMLSPQAQQAFLEVFSSLPQRVLWKFESDTLHPKSENVLLGKWLPQRDILGHKNMKLFITHNGLMSSQESLHFGVPTVGIPFFMDQDRNMQRACRFGTGVGLSYKHLNKDTIFQAINQVLSNSSYAENARRLSRIFRDQPEHPLDRAVFWVEYVLRHGGAPHFRTAAVGMPLYQYLLLDILGALLVALVVTLLLLRAGALWLWRRLGAAGRKEKTN